MSAFELGYGVQTLQILGWALLHSLWIGALVGIIFAALRKLVLNHISARYWLGVGCLFAFASIEIALFVNALISALLLPDVITAASTASLTMLPTLASNTGAQLIVQPSSMPLTMLIGLAWLLGVGVSTWRLLRSHRTLRLLALNAQSDTYSELRRLCAPLLDLLNLRTNVSFAVSELIDVPCVIGIFKPVVLLPAAVLARMPQDQLELVLLHELSHIKNGDLWINFAQIMVEVLMFFHPVVHWISADVRMTRERRCDRAVLSVREAPLRYAHALVSLEEFRHEFRGLALAATGGELSSRVRDILASRARSVTITTRRSMRGTVLLSLAATMVFAGAVASAIVQKAVKVRAATPAQVVDLPNNLAAPVAIFAVPVPAEATVARLARTAPVSRLAQPVMPAERRRQNYATIARVLAPGRDGRERNFVPMQTLPKHVFDRVAVLDLSKVEVRGTLDNVTQPPKVIARVTPTFVPGQRKRQAFSLSFSLDAAGAPQQIRLAGGRASEKQLLAARTALAQWRFEPEASANFAGNRLEQAFSFEELTPARCKPTVGTRICR